MRVGEKEFRARRKVTNTAIGTTANFTLANFTTT